MAVASVNGYEFNYDLAGPADGELVLLLHGFPQDHLCWSEIASDLNQAGYRTLAVDQRGYSPGARPTSNSNYNMANLVSDAVGFIDEVGASRAHVVGHDWGGIVAWALAAAHPDRVASLTVLSTPHPVAMSHALTHSSQALKSWYMGLFQIPGVAEYLLLPGRKAWDVMMTGLPTEAKEHYSENALVPGALTAMLRWYRALPGDIRTPSVRVGRITTPTLYVWGRRDPALGEAAARGTAKFVTGPYTFVALPDQGHWLPELGAREVLPLLKEHLHSYPATT